MLWLLMLGCINNDPLSVMGLGPVIVLRSPEPAAAPELPARSAPQPASLELPSRAPGSGEDIADGGLREVPDGSSAAAAAPQPAPVKFDPISVPLGPREGGVRWEGVTKRNERVVDFEDGESTDPNLGM